MREKYHQPDFYHFSRSSIELAHYAERIFELKGRRKIHVLDLFSGSGVIGLEFLKKIEEKQTSLDVCLSFCEISTEMIASLEFNLKGRHHVYHSSFEKLGDIGEVDLILANPPYFDSTKVRLSRNQERNECLVRSFSWNDFFDFLLSRFRGIPKMILFHQHDDFKDLLLKHPLGESLFTEQILNEKESIVHLL